MILIQKSARIVAFIEGCKVYMKAMIRICFEQGIRIVIYPLNVLLAKPSRFSVRFHELLKWPCASVLTKHGEIKLFAQNNVMWMRSRTYFTKEPETLSWIDGFDEGDVLYDIGANIGIYSLYAARKGHRVIAFEPESQNHAIFNRHISLNQLSDKITLLGVALADKCGLSKLNLSHDMVGSALHTLGEAVDFDKHAMQPVFSQSIIAYSLDQLVDQYNCVLPHHIKIDVDGIEKEVVEGGSKTLLNPNVKSILIELNDGLESDHEIKDFLLSNGFSIKAKCQPDNLTQRFEKLFNYIFVKTDGR